MRGRDRAERVLTRWFLPEYSRIGGGQVVREVEREDTAIRDSNSAKITASKTKTSTDTGHR